MKLVPFLVSMLCASVALAEPPPAPSTPAQGAVAELVDKQLVAPLKKAESRRAKFSRAAPAPVQRRVRVEAETLTDARGKQFVRFAIDERRGWEVEGTWHEDRVVGCAYLQEREVLVRHKQGYFPARLLLGKSEQARPGACSAAPAGGGELASAK